MSFSSIIFKKSYILIVGREIRYLFLKYMWIWTELWQIAIYLLLLGKEAILLIPQIPAGFPVFLFILMYLLSPHFAPKSSSCWRSPVPCSFRIQFLPPRDRAQSHSARQTTPAINPGNPNLDVNVWSMIHYVRKHVPRCRTGNLGLEASMAMFTVWLANAFSRLCSLSAGTSWHPLMVTAPVIAWKRCNTMLISLKILEIIF